MTILGVLGSPRRSGNSAHLLEMALRGAESAGARRLPTVQVNDLNLRTCRNCGGCAPSGICVERDDMTDIYPLLRSADIWLFASPIYYDNITGSLKSFFDRFFCFDKPSGCKLSGARTGGFIITYEDEPRADYLRTVEIYCGYLSWFGDFVYTDAIEGSRLGAPNDAKSRPTLESDADALGRRLVERLR